MILSMYLLPGNNNPHGPQTVTGSMSSVDTPFSDMHGLCGHPLFTHTWSLWTPPFHTHMGTASRISTLSSSRWGVLHGNKKLTEQIPQLCPISHGNTVSADQIMSSRSLAPLKRKRCWLKGLGEENQNWLTSVVV